MQVEYRQGNGRSFFAASNSRRGFQSYYESCFRHRVDRLICIKGGPGTGKSTLMRHVANEAERRGWRAEYYYCSSDADSLDAVLLFGKGRSLGLVDATLPHTFEPGLPGAEEEILDPYPDSVSEDIQPCGRYVIREAVRLFKGDRTGLFIAYVKVPEKEFMDFAKPRDGSPATMMSLLMARAVREELGQTELPIICAMAMDIRPVLKKLLAHHSVVSQLFLEYGEKMASLPLETQATAFRGMVLLQSQPENVLTSVRNNLRFVENLRQMDSLDARRRFMQGIVERSMTMSSFKFSYPGRLDLGVAEKYIKNQLIYPDITGAGLMLEVAAHGGFFHISFLQEYEDERYYRAFLRQLDAMRLPYEAGKFVPYAVPGVEL